MTEAAQLETGTEDLLARVQGGVAVLTLNRPDRRNALSARMLAGLARVLERIESDRELRAVVLTGAGRGFCAGGDLKGMSGDGGAAAPAAGGGATWDEAVHAQRLSQRNVVARIYRMPKPVIASLPGAAAGAGMGIALACDLRIAADSAAMVTAFTRVGFSGDYGLPWLLAQAVGRSRALDLLYFSDKLDASRCLELGLVDRVVPEAELQDTTMQLARQLAEGPQVALRYAKENVNAAFEQSLEAYMDGEVMRHLSAGRTEDHREAVQAFVERRQPVFKGR